MFEAACVSTHIGIIAGKCPWCGKFILRGVTQTESLFHAIEETETHLPPPFPFAKLLEAIVDLISNEDKSQPYTDDQLLRKLADRGMIVARRTVTKIRKKLGIAAAAERRLS